MYQIKEPIDPAKSIAIRLPSHVVELFLKSDGGLAVWITEDHTKDESVTLIFTSKDRKRLCDFLRSYE